MLDLSIRNFRCLSQIDLRDEAKISVVLGPNEAGKSSLAGAIGYVFTGSAFDLRGSQVPLLIRDGQTRMKVSLRCGGFDISRTPTSGPSLKDLASRFRVDPATLPMAFNPSLCSSGKDIGRFLEALGEVNTGPGFFPCPAELTPFFTEAREKSGKETTAGVLAAAAELRAQSKAPASPIKPLVPRLENSVAALELHYPNVAAAAELSQKISNMRQLVAYFELPSSVDDPLEGKRDALLSCQSIDTKPLDRIATVLLRAGFAPASTKVESLLRIVEKAIKEASDTLASNPMPASAPIMSDAAKDALSLLDQQDATGAKAAIENFSKEKSSLLEGIPENISTPSLLDAEIRRVKDSLILWQAYDAAVAGHEEVSQKATLRWNGFQALITAIGAWQSELQSSITTEFLDDVSKSAFAVLGGRKLTISPDKTLCLDGLSSDLLSGSARWRLLSCVMAAIAKRCLDGMDVLDPENQATNIAFVSEYLAPSFEHVLITSTFRGRDSDRASFNSPLATKWILENGEISAIV